MPFRRACLAVPLLVFGFALGSLLSRAAYAGSYAEALTGFTQGSLSDTGHAIQKVLASGNPLAERVLSALQDGRLMYSAEKKTVYIQSKNGKLIDAVTGKLFTAKPPGDIDNVIVNNRLRNVISADLGTLMLVSANPNHRYNAAQAVFRSRNPSALSNLEKALTKETNPRVKLALEQARAAILLKMPNVAQAQKLAAIAEVRERGDRDALALLADIPSRASPPVARAATEAIQAIKTRLALWASAQNVWYGLSLGSVLLLAAIGLAITFGVMGVINMAHGEMVMLGAYVTFVVQQVIRGHDPALFDYSLAVAVPLAFLFSGFVGILIERGMIRFLYGRPLETLLATFGLSLILQQAVRTVFGADNRDVGTPAFMAGAFHIGGLEITYGRMWIIVFAAIVFILLQLILRTTSFGLRMRAVTQNRRMASSMGISTNRIDALAFGLGSGIAGIAGVALSQIDNVSPNLGQSYIIDSFMVVVFGGVGNLWGTLVAALILGVANKVLEPFAGAVLGKIALLVFIILFIQKRPRGLFALKGRAIEA